ncbi:MAG: OmpA family protein [Bacteroidota bacterium]|nr:OmpA family protein [Bacteroidota bacterium]
MKNIYTIIIAALFCITVNAQTKKADRLYNNWEYYEAAKLYQKAIDKNPTTDLYYKLGECYRKMNCYKKSEQEAYDKVNAAGTYSKPEFYLNYGQVLKSNGRYSESKIAFNKYTELVPSDPRGKFYSESIDTVVYDHQWDEQITISNVAKLNSKEADFSPVLYKDGIVFASSRKTAGHGKVYPWTGSNYLDLYYAKSMTNNDTNYTDLAPLGGKHIDNKYHDGPACFSKNYDTIYTTRVEKYLKGDEKKTLGIERNKIFMLTKKDGEWTKAVAFPHNSNNYSVANPFLSPDGSRLYFVSDMAGGYGETDLYYCNRVGDTWGSPINMGSNINTFNREKYPSMDSAGNFYFASNGYQGLGGMDVCVALNNNGRLEKAKPMKYPFNSTADDNGIIFLKSGKTGYITSNRNTSGNGEDDILYFDLNREDLDSDFVTSIYTIGYRPKPPVEVLAVVPVEEPIIVKANLDQIVKVKAPMPINGIIYFDFDKYDIRPDAISYLDSVVNYMKEFPDMKLIVGGHCDSRGTPEYNIVLSNDRHAAAVRYLNKKGVGKKRMVATGYGLSQVVNRCVQGVECSDAEDQMNRRVEFHFEGKKVANAN